MTILTDITNSLPSSFTLSCLPESGGSDAVLTFPSCDFVGVCYL